MNTVFDRLLKEKEFVFFDGALGTVLQSKGLELGAIPEILNITNPQMLVEIHKEYISAGADIISTNTFGANRYKLQGSGYTVENIIKAGVANAKAAADGTDVLMALSLGPIGKLLEPAGTLTFDEAYDVYKEQVIAGQDADLILLETMTDLSELKAAVLAAKENTSLPILCTMTFEENSRTFTGCGVRNMALTMQGLGVDALGVNCSLGPDQLYPVIKELSKCTSLPIMFQPNAGLPDPNSSTYDVTAEDFAKSMEEFVPLGVKIFGGCCGTTPEYIRKTRERLSHLKYKKNDCENGSYVCSASGLVKCDRPRIIGERINPTGKKRFKEALMNNDMGYILSQAIEQVDAGADILDVNVGLPGIDEGKMMVKTIKTLQGITSAPLQIDSTKPKVIEQALRVYTGKAIVNSVNGEEDSLKTILPLVKKYGAMVIGLTLDENGIPESAQGRFDIAEKIVNRAIEVGIAREDIIVDCLTLTASAQQEGVMETIKALKMVKDKLGVKTVLGVSNISFGLPNRELVNQTFLTTALAAGLDFPIINPNIPGMTGAVRAYNVLNNVDKNSAEFIKAYNNVQTEQKTQQRENESNDLQAAVIQGLEQKAADTTKILLESIDAMDIVNNQLIPALDKVGQDFEKGTLFLPQLIQSAQAAQSCFEVIKEHISKTSGESVSKGKIVIATVKGDIHDIGKNIVKTLLENYGYTVIDLGKDVPPEDVLNAAVEHKAKLVGLSALMTTTLQSMEDTIKLLHEKKVACEIMVGGAVLTPEYAMKIGADYYCKDAKESVDTAKKVFGS